jgi:hypothetical protein
MIDNEGRLRTKLYDKRDDFNSPIVNFPFMRSTFPAAPSYGVYISQMIRYSRACHMQKEKQQRSTKHIYKVKGRVTRVPLKTGVNSGAPE